MRYYIEHLPMTIPMGVQSENNAEAVELDVSDWLARDGSLSFSVWVTRPGETEAYQAANATLKDGILYWWPTSADTAIAGEGRVEILAVSANRRMLSGWTATSIRETTTETTTDTPVDQRPWLDQALLASEEAKAAAASAAASADKAEGVVKKEIATLTKDIGSLSYEMPNLILDNFSNAANWYFAKYSSTLENNVAALIPTATVPAGMQASARYNGNIQKFVRGHSYYASVEMYCETEPGIGRLYIGDSFTPNTRFEKSNWTLIDGIATPANNEEMGFYITKIYGNNANEGTLKLRNPICIDLTAAEIDGLSVYDIRKLTSGIYSERYVKSVTEPRDNLLNKESFLVASKDSEFAAYADLVTNGANDQLLINALITRSDVKTIRFADDSVFNLTAEVKLKSGLTLKSRGAKFVTENAVAISESDVKTQISAGDTSIQTTYEIAKNFVAGMFIEVSSGSGNEAFYIKSIDYGNGIINIDGSFAKTHISSETKITNVSSCFSGVDVENVTIDGLEIDWNYPTNERAYNTFWAQNGIHFDRSNYCVIKNCKINNGGRHGILFCDTNYSKILNCSLDNWGEHCIDIYNRNYNAPPKNHCVVDDCICTNAQMCGIQLHCGSGVIVSNCVCNFNVLHGISMLQNGHGNIAHDCTCNSNGNYGLYCNRGIHDVNIGNCHFTNNERDGIQIDTDCYSITISNSEFLDNGWSSLFIYDSSKVVVTGNLFKGSTESQLIKLENGSSRNLINGNMFDKGNGKATVGVGETTSDCDYNIVANNMMIGVNAAASLDGEHSVMSNNHVF